MLLRALAVFLCLLLLPLRAPRELLAAEEIWAPLVVLFFALVLNLSYFLLRASIQRVRFFALTQLILDALLSGILIYLTGGVHSQYVFLFFSVVMAASFVVSLRASIGIATFSVGLLSANTLLYWLSESREFLLPFLTADFEFFPKGLPSTVAILLAQALALYIVGYLSGVLARRLEQQELVNQQILEGVGEGIFSLDKSGRIAFINSACIGYLGLQGAKPLIGKRFSEVAAGIDPIIKGVLTAMQEARFEVTIAPKGKKGTPFAVSTSRLLDEKGHLRGFVMVLHDLTERRRMEDSLKRIDKLETISEMAAGIAHEIRNPLASIRGSAQELGGGEIAGEVSKKLLAVIVRESDRLNRIVTEFLQYARMPPAQPHRLRLRNLLQEVTTLLKKRASEDAFEIKLIIRDDCCCRADQEQLKQVFLNIGINALEAMENGGILRLSLSEIEASQARKWVADISEQPDQHFAKIDFIDNGVGIKEKDIARIFDPFFTTRTQGTGLGLAIAQRIVEAHGGKIIVSSRYQHGARFSVLLEAVL